MNKIIYLVFVLISGFIIGILFYGGLWFTVKKSLQSKTPAPFFLVSFIVRIGLALTGIYFTTSGELKNLVVCMVGFIIGRILVAYLTKEKENNNEQIRKEVVYEDQSR